jgi:hypothetical protein
VHSIAKTADVNLTANNLKNSFCHRVTETQRNSQERSENFSLIKTVIPHYWREEKKDREFMADWASSEQKSLVSVTLWQNKPLNLYRNRIAWYYVLRAVHLAQRS